MTLFKVVSGRMAIHNMMRSNHGIMTLFKVVGGRMAIHNMMRSNHGIMTLFKVVSGRMEDIISKRPRGAEER